MSFFESPPPNDNQLSAQEIIRSMGKSAKGDFIAGSLAAIFSAAFAVAPHFLWATLYDQKETELQHDAARLLSGTYTPYLAAIKENRPQTTLPLLKVIEKPDGIPYLISCIEEERSSNHASISIDTPLKAPQQIDVENPSTLNISQIGTCFRETYANEKMSEYKRKNDLLQSMSYFFSYSMFGLGGFGAIVGFCTAAGSLRERRKAIIELKTPTSGPSAP